MFFGPNAATFGILTEPRLGANAAGVVSLPTRSSFHRNRFPGRLLARLAEHGFHGMRFDGRGAGESLGRAPRVSHLDMVDGEVAEDVAGAVACLTARGVERVALVGHCRSGRIALAAASGIPEVSWVVVLAAPIHDRSQKLAAGSSLPQLLGRGLNLGAIRKLAEPEARRTYARHLGAKLRHTLRMSETGNGAGGQGWSMSPAARRDVERLAGDGVRTAFVYGEHDEYLKELADSSGSIAGFTTWLGGVGGELLRIPDAMVHNLRNLSVQEEVIDAVTAWLAAVVAGEAADREEGSR